MVAGLLLAILIFAGALSYFIPQGSYTYNEDGSIVPGTYVASNIDGIAFWRVLFYTIQKGGVL